jgi:hypothetical protein
MKAAANNIHHLPIVSDKSPAVIITTIPTIVDAVAIKPTVDKGTPRERINSERVGF